MIADPAINARWEKVRKYFFLRESTYDMTSRCNIRCNGCYYFEGEKQYTHDENNVSAWEALLRREKERGITFAVLAGAEPSLVPDLCEICCREIPLGAIATNGLKFIPARINYKIHISVWGNDATSYKTRNAGEMLARQLANYINDPRAVFIYTFTPHNIEEAEAVTAGIADQNGRVSFNIFSAPVGYTGDLRHTPRSLLKTGKMMIKLMNRYPDQVLFSHYNAVAHTHAQGLHDLFSCTYPRQNPTENVGLGKSFRQYRTDLTWDRQAACCVPDTDCADCRHYAAGSAVVTARLFRHAGNPEQFKAWLDYVDTYLAVWVLGYAKGRNLSNRPVPPPGFDLSPGLINSVNAF
ncbi:MAG: radical SAM protein [Desulfobacterales bacterium]|nr:radical SAM protein [Desulfobacterales bacterium]